MIFETIITWVTNALELIISILPMADSAIITQINAYTNTFRSLLSGINWFFPVNTALLFLSLMFVIQTSVLSFKLIRYVAGVLTAGILK